MESWGTRKLEGFLLCNFADVEINFLFQEAFCEELSNGPAFAVTDGL